MDFIVSWLNQIVLIVLFAIVLDLVIPSSSMQKYVKLVMGLLIMVTLLKPVSSLFDHGFDISQIQWPDNIAQFASLDSITSRAGDMQKQQAAAAEKQLQAHLEQTVKQQLESEHPVEVLTVQADIHTGSGQQSGPASISKLLIQMRPSSGTQRNRGITPVESVQIHAAQHSDTQSGSSNEAEQAEISKLIQKELATQFGISGSLISIDWKSG